MCRLKLIELCVSCWVFSPAPQTEKLLNVTSYAVIFNLALAELLLWHRIRNILTSLFFTTLQHQKVLLNICQVTSYSYWYRHIALLLPRSIEANLYLIVILCSFVGFYEQISSQKLNLINDRGSVKHHKKVIFQEALKYQLICWAGNNKNIIKA